MPNILSFIGLLILVSLIIFWPLIKESKNIVFLSENSTKKDKLLEILRDIELEYELGNISLETYQKSKADYASELRKL